MKNKLQFLKVILLLCIFSLMFNACGIPAQSEGTPPEDNHHTTDGKQTGPPVF